MPHRAYRQVNGHSRYVAMPGRRPGLLAEEEHHPDMVIHGNTPQAPSIHQHYENAITRSFNELKLTVGFHLAADNTRAPPTWDECYDVTAIHLDFRTLALLSNSRLYLGTNVGSVSGS